MSESNQSPDFILFAQHGWADSAKQIHLLAKKLATPNTEIVAPNLGWLNTWWYMEPHIERVMEQVEAIAQQYPYTPWRIVGHSMGGLIWLEILHRRPQWQKRIHSLVLLASPIGGAHLARAIDPLEIGIGVARDLSKNRREMAEKVASRVPTLVIAGDIDGGSDGTVLVQTTYCRYAQFTTLELSHPTLRNHPDVVPIVQEFWQHPRIVSVEPADLNAEITERLSRVPGITDAHQKESEKSRPILIFQNGSRLNLWRNPIGIEHVFLLDASGRCLFSGFVGWLHSVQLKQAIAAIKRDYQHEIEALPQEENR